MWACIVTGFKVTVSSEHAQRNADSVASAMLQLHYVMHMWISQADNCFLFIVDIFRCCWWSESGFWCPGHLPPLCHVPVIHILVSTCIYITHKCFHECTIIAQLPYVMYMCMHVLVCIGLSLTMAWWHWLVVMLSLWSSSTRTVWPSHPRPHPISESRYWLTCVTIYASFIVFM